MAFLHRRNFICMCLHLFNGVSILLMSKTMTKLEAFSVPVSTIFLDYTTDKIPYQNLHTNFWPFPYVTASSLFAFMSAAAHGLVLANFDIYESQLRRGLNHFRWIEYAFSSSLIITLISMLFGIWDFFSLIVIFCINGSMCLFGDIHERVNAGREPQDIDWSAFIYGTIAGLYPWVMIGVFCANSSGVSAAPTFVWIILATYFIMFCTFPATMYLQYM